MRGYLNEAGEPAPIEGDCYRTGDVAARDSEGYFTFIGRADDVFKSSDFRLSPFELESALIEHEAVVEAAVVPAPDPVRYSTPKAYITLVPGHAADRVTAAAIFEHVRNRLSPYKRVRRIEFGELPKTASGKIRRVELRNARERAGRSQRAGRGRVQDRGFSRGLGRRPRASGPAVSNGAAKPNEGQPSAHICVSEPWPFGVFMASQAPLATYFQ